tara:strand:+ start:10201 stop:11001 length:801 start_codon:yes stop_codon:yes gene_type:complete
MTTIDRKQLIAEELIRDHIRKRISHKLNETFTIENQIRKVVRNLLEAEAGTTEPSEFTGINVLADLLEKVVPVIEDDFKMLTTSVEQRESFRNHIVQAIKNTLKPIEASTQAEETKEIPENFQFEIDTDLLSEKIKIDLDADDSNETVSGEFIDIDSEGSADQDDFVELQDQNETGRNFAATTFKKVEKQIVDAYDMLADDEDKKLFYDYLLTNMLLYFDKFEDELQPSLPDSTTADYEEEKKDDETETSDETSDEESMGDIEMEL